MPQDSTKHDQVAETSPPGFADTAKRISGWSANLLATGVVLIAGLVFGRQVLHWWATDPTEARRTDLVAEVVGPDATGSLAILEFGDFDSTVLRSEITGSVDDVLGELRRSCREAADQDRDIMGEAGPAESRMLAGTTRLETVESEPGAWDMYEISRPLPMVTVVRQLDRIADDGCALRRLVCWGMGVPSVAEGNKTPDSWTLFTYVLGSEPAAESSRRSLPIPPETTRTMSLASTSGGALIGFSGGGPASEWMAFYDTWTEKNGWSSTSRWKATRNRWSRRFTKGDGGFVDVEIVNEGSRKHGLLNVALPRAKESEAE